MSATRIPSPSAISKVLEAAREFRERGSKPQDKSEGEAFLEQRLGHKPSEVESELFWAEVGTSR